MRVWIVEIGEQISGIDGNVRDWHCGMLAKALAAKGHQVVLWASTFHHLTKRHRFKVAQRRELAPGLQAQFLHGPGYASNKSLKRVLHHWVTARSFSREAATEAEPDIVFCSLPTIELAEQSTRYGRRRKIPVIIDIADLWPDIYLSVFPGWMRSIARKALAWEFHRTQRALQMASGITAVSQTYLDWGLSYAKRPAGASDGVFPLGYPRPAATASEAEAQMQQLCLKHDIHPHGLIVTFIGTFGASYDLETVVRAAALLRSSGVSDIQIVLAGVGDQAPKLHDLAKGLDNVIFTGWLDRLSVLALMRLSSVGLVAYRSEALQSLPNKPFEYMSAGLPLLSSLRGELEDLIREERIGLQYQAGDAAALVERIRWLAANPGAREAMGQRSRTLFESTYSAEVIYPRLVQHLEQVVRAGGQE